MDPQRTARRWAGERAHRVEATIDRPTGRAACPVGVAELADEYGSATRPALLRSGVRDGTDGEFDSQTAVRAALARLTGPDGSRPGATLGGREQS